MGGARPGDPIGSGRRIRRATHGGGFPFARPGILGLMVASQMRVERHENMYVTMLELGHPNL
jgi:hypothetical protein